MNGTSLKSALIGGIAGAVMAAGTAALAGTGIGGVFNLGVDNSVDGANGLPDITTDITIEGNGSTITRSSEAPIFRSFPRKSLPP